MSKNRGCSILTLLSEPGFNHTTLPQTASPHRSNLIRRAPSSETHVPKTSPAKLAFSPQKNAATANVAAPAVLRLPSLDAVMGGRR